MTNLTMIAATLMSGILASCQGVLKDTDYETVRRISVAQAKLLIKETSNGYPEKGN